MFAISKDTAAVIQRTNGIKVRNANNVYQGFESMQAPRAYVYTHRGGHTRASLSVCVCVCVCMCVACVN